MVVDVILPAMLCPDAIMSMIQLRGEYGESLTGSGWEISRQTLGTAMISSGRALNAYVMMPDSPAVMALACYDIDISNTAALTCNKLERLGHKLILVVRHAADWSVCLAR